MRSLANEIASAFTAALERRGYDVGRKPIVMVGPRRKCRTIASAFRQVDPGGTIYVLPSHTETFNP